jgi:hypothetical protein
MRDSLGTAERPFAADYPSGAPADAAGRLTHDIEGRPLAAQYVVGRRVVGGDDQAIPATQFDALAEATTGRGIALVPAREIGGDFGRTAIDRVTGLPTLIRMRKDMQPDKAAMVAQHELGHSIEEIAGQIPTKGLSNELKGIYNTLNNPRRSKAGLRQLLGVSLSRRRFLATRAMKSRANIWQRPSAPTWQTRTISRPSHQKPPPPSAPRSMRIPR